MGADATRRGLHGRPRAARFGVVGTRDRGKRAHVESRRRGTAPFRPVAPCDRRATYTRRVDPLAFDGEPLQPPGEHPCLARGERLGALGNADLQFD